MRLLADSCPGDDCPKIYVDEQGRIIVQGYEHDGNTPSGEAMVTITPELLLEAADAYGRNR